MNKTIELNQTQIASIVGGVSQSSKHTLSESKDCLEFCHIMVAYNLIHSTGCYQGCMR